MTGACFFLKKMMKTHSLYRYVVCYSTICSSCRSTWLYITSKIHDMCFESCHIIVLHFDINTVKIQTCLKNLPQSGKK